MPIRIERGRDTWVVGELVFGAQEQASPFSHDGQHAASPSQPRPSAQPEQQAPMRENYPRARQSVYRSLRISQTTTTPAPAAATKGSKGIAFEPT